MKYDAKKKVEAIGLTVIIALLLLILFVVVIVFRKWKVFIISVVCFSIVIVLVFKFPVFLQKSTELSGEGLNQVIVGSLIDKDDTSQIENNVIYLALKRNPKILMRIEKDIIKELTLVTEPIDTSISTMKGINLNSTFADVVHNYGESYRNLRFVEMYGVGIEYRDKKNGIIVQFFFDNDKLNSQVRNIEVIKSNRFF